MKILVVPSIRQSCLNDFLARWVPDWDKLIVVEDNAWKTFHINDPNIHHFSWEDIEKDLGKDSWIISRKDSAIRSYGFYKAWQMGAEYCFSLDDDCYPTPLINGRFCSKHIEMMENTPKWTESILGMRTRGIPYYNKGKLENVMCNHGLWENVPDFDSIQTLSMGEIPYFAPAFTNRVMPHGQYYCHCGMNFAFKRNITVLSYFPLMGEGSPYRRFDDIWFGVILKKICDHLRYYVTCGEPVIHHARASDPMTNLIKEAPGIAFNEKFWNIIESVGFKESTPEDCMLELGSHLEKQDDDYVKKLGKAIGIWTKLFTDSHLS